MFIYNTINQIVDFIERRFFTPETFCGTGSYLKNTEATVAFLRIIFNRSDIKSIADIGCGDLNWLSTINLPELGIGEYVGYDFDKEMLEIARNRTKGSTIFDFRKYNIVNTVSLDKYDLILCRDLFIHLETEQIIHLLDVFKSSGSKYLITTTYNLKENTALNSTIKYSKRVRDSRKIDLIIPPYNLPTPNEWVYESKCGPDRLLCLWDLDSLII